MRILHIVISLDMGGLEMVVCALANAQIARGHEVCLGVVEYPGMLADRVQAGAVWIGDLAHRGRWRTALALARFVRKHQIEVIHSHDPQPHFYAVLARLLTGVRVIHTKHGRNYPDMPRRVFLNRVLAWFTERVVAVSEDVAELARTLERTNPRKVVVVRNGVDYRRFTGEGRLATENTKKHKEGEGDFLCDSLRSLRQIKSGNSHKEHREAQSGLQSSVFSPRSGPLIGSVGRLSREKNYGLLLEAFARMTLPEARLLLVGDGPERGTLEALAGELGIAERVMFAGRQTDPLPYYRQMDVFCLSSDTEGTPMTLLEAGACGVPAVVTDVGGNAEVVQDGVTGLVVPKGDAGALAAALERLCGDAALRVQTGTAARQRVAAEYSVEAMVAGYEDVLRGEY